MTIYRKMPPGTHIQKHVGGSIYKITGTTYLDGEQMYTLSNGLMLPVNMEYILN